VGEHGNGGGSCGCLRERGRWREVGDGANGWAMERRRRRRSTATRPLVGPSQEGEGDGTGRSEPCWLNSRREGEFIFLFQINFQNHFQIEFLNSNLFCINPHITKIKCCSMNASTCS